MSNTSLLNSIRLQLLPMSNSSETKLELLWVMDSLNSQIGRLPEMFSCLLTGRRYLLQTSISNLTGLLTVEEQLELPPLLRRNHRCMEVKDSLTCTKTKTKTKANHSKVTPVQQKVTRSTQAILSQVSTTSFSCKLSNRFSLVSMRPKSFATQ